MGRPRRSTLSLAEGGWAGGYRTAWRPHKKMQGENLKEEEGGEPGAPSGSRERSGRAREEEGLGLLPAPRPALLRLDGCSQQGSCRP